MRRNENNRDQALDRNQLRLKFGTAYAWHPHVENKTIGRVKRRRIQKIRGQCERLDPEAYGFKQSFERLPDGLVIVHN